MSRLSHTPTKAPAGAGDAATLLKRASARLARARLAYGHGTERPVDDAAALLAHAMGLRRPLEERDLRRTVSPRARQRFQALLDRRIRERIPAVYLTRRCWWAGLPFYVDERVLIPRSPIAELVENQFSPWVDPAAVRRIADLGTGSGCIALACAVYFPKSRVDAVDVDPEALAVARINRQALGLTRRVRLVKSDFFAKLGARRYDIIVSNPPYVGTAEFNGLPPEYAHEPEGALRSGRDGMNAVRVLLRESARHLTDAGVLVVEVGNTETRVRRAFPKLPFVWLSFERGGGGVFLLTAAQLKAALRSGSVG
ncbi:MAG: 50S ribosomal protein L3 N(5)-glutamine methyltransferase [Pseudomonadota bacterium]|nr:MAG: 50S ribosomal protein L3 N(5)-glutamine methyltransferase [Pseudomonadota bacterium]